MSNENLKLIISFSDKKDLEFTLDNNFSFQEIKTKIFNEFNISESDDSINIKLSDIKYEKIDSDNNQIKIILNSNNNLNNLDLNNSEIKQKVEEKQKEIDSLKNEINLLKNDIDSNNFLFNILFN